MGPVEAEALVVAADLVFVTSTRYTALVIAYQTRRLVAPVAVVALDALLDAKVAVAALIDVLLLVSLYRHSLRQIVVFLEDTVPVGEVDVVAQVLISRYNARRRRRRAKQVQYAPVGVTATRLRRRARVRLVVEGGPFYHESGR